MMKMSTNGKTLSPSAIAARNFMSELKIIAPTTYRAINEAMGSQGMGALSGFWDNLGGAINNIVQKAPEIYLSKEQANKELKAAQNLAESQLNAARLELQRQQTQAAMMIEQARMQQDQMMLADQIARQQQLQAEANGIDSVLANLSGTQKTGLLVAGALGVVLLVSLMSDEK